MIESGNRLLGEPPITPPFWPFSSDTASLELTNHCPTLVSGALSQLHGRIAVTNLNRSYYRGPNIYALSRLVSFSLTAWTVSASSARRFDTDAQQAFGHGVRAKRSKSGAISFDLLSAEGKDAVGE